MMTPLFKIQSNGGGEASRILGHVSFLFLLSLSCPSPKRENNFIFSQDDSSVIEEGEVGERRRGASRRAKKMLHDAVAAPAPPGQGTLAEILES